MSDDPRRQLPSVDRLLQEPAINRLLDTIPRSVVVAAAREAVAVARRGRSDAPEDWAADVSERASRLARRSLRPVLNATGVVLHTNLGRAPLARAAVEAVTAIASGYSALEYDLEAGVRGHRTDHGRRLLAELTGAEDALVVNNAASALVVALNTVAAGMEVIISRGELVEIGGSFRIPDILAKSGARLREVGTTNRTHLDDYRRAIGPATGAILKVHQSNFEQSGFVHSPLASDLVRLAHEHGLLLLHDIGSGLMVDLSPFGLTTEPRVPDAVADGADLVLFSGDKLLGGPQAGCMVGGAELLAQCRANPLTRAARADKMTFAALEATLELYRDQHIALREIPVLQMLTLSAAELGRRAEALAAAIQTAVPTSPLPRLAAGTSVTGGGSFPLASLPTTLVMLDPGPRGADSLALALRLGDPPVVARVADGMVVLDPRTLLEDCFPALANAIAAASQE
ncbi:MAG: L-seryl-tRNA(Sec) selenium transferase [Gemmatimonadales bacterium]|nr:MAG: L-seryl-tRNA(Sec) selenium transferase [Gemmatimonadales bacterium]